LRVHSSFEVAFLVVYDAHLDTRVDLLDAYADGQRLEDGFNAVLEERLLDRVRAFETSVLDEEEVFTFLPVVRLHECDSHAVEGHEEGLKVVVRFHHVGMLRVGQFLDLLGLL
jgi:hypothetical protein